MPVVTIKTPERRIRASELAIGQIGIADDGTIMLRVYKAIISLDNPHNTWTPACGEWVQLVQPGSTVSFVVS